MKDRLTSRWARACTKWKNRLFLGSWTFNISVRSRLEPQGYSRTEGRTAAKTEFVSAYRNADIMLKRDSMGDEELNKYACHEVSHLVIAKLNTLAVEAIDALPKTQRDGWHRRLAETVEETTSQLENVFLWSVKEWKDG